MSNITVDLDQLYQRHFGSKPVVPVVIPEYETAITGSIGEPATAYDESRPTINTPASSYGNDKLGKKGSLFKTNYLGVEIWLPVTLKLPDGTDFYLPYCTVTVSGNSNWVKTPLAERKGSVKELYNVEDYTITLRGFFIDKNNRFFPEDDLEKLERLHTSGESFEIINAVTDFFLLGDDRVVMEGFELVATEGGGMHVKPFLMKLASDSIFTLEYNL